MRRANPPSLDGRRHHDTWTVASCCNWLCLLASITLAHPSPAIARPGDPTSGALLIFPGQSPATADIQSSPLATREGEWNIPGRHFRPNDGWWTLICGANCVLETRRLKIRAGTQLEHDGPDSRSQILSWHPQTATPGREEVGQPLLHFKPAAAAASIKFKAGPVPTWPAIATARTASEDDRNTLQPATIATPGGRAATLRPQTVPIHADRKHASPTDEPAANVDHPASIRIELSVGGKKQGLGQVHGEYDLDSLPTLSAADYVLWSGDLDGDGKLDLLLRFDLHQWDVVLYLSSLARPGELVGEAGRFRFAPFGESGC